MLPRRRLPPGKPGQVNLLWSRAYLLGMESLESPSTKTVRGSAVGRTLQAVRRVPQNVRRKDTSCQETCFLQEREVGLLRLFTFRPSPIARRQRLMER